MSLVVHGLEFMYVVRMQVPVPLLDEAVLAVSMFDKLGRRFDNFSSMFVEWISSDHSLGMLQRELSSEDAVDPALRTPYHRKLLLKET